MTQRSLSTLKSIFKNTRNSSTTRMHAMLEYTGRFYNSDNRAFRNDLNFSIDPGCVYSPTKTSPGCAIGQHLTTETAWLFDNANKGGVDSSIPTIKAIVKKDPSLKPEVFAATPEWLRTLPVEFLAYIQSLHDGELNWDEGGLSEDGKAEYEYIVSQINSGNFIR